MKFSQSSFLMLIPVYLYTMEKDRVPLYKTKATSELTKIVSEANDNPYQPDTFGTIAAIKHLIRNGANPNQEYFSKNPLWYAFSINDEDLTIFLMAYNANPNFHTILKSASLHAFVNSPTTKIAPDIRQTYRTLFDFKDPRLLLAAARFNNKNLANNVFNNENVTIDAQNEDGNTPLMIAISNKNSAMVELFLSKNASINGMQNKDGLTAYDLAKKTSPVMVKLLDDHLKISKKNVNY